MMSDKTLSTGGYLLYSQVGEDFCEIGTLESAEPIEWDNKYEGNYVSLNLDALTEVSHVFPFTEKQWKKMQKALGIYEYKFKKVRKGKRMVRVVL